MIVVFAYFYRHIHKGVFYTEKRVRVRYITYIYTFNTFSRVCNKFDHVRGGCVAFASCFDTLHSNTGLFEEKQYETAGAAEVRRIRS